MAGKEALWHNDTYKSPLRGAHLFLSPLEGFPDNRVSLYTEIKADETHPASDSLKQYTDNSYKSTAGGRSISSVQRDLLSLQIQPSCVHGVQADGY